MDPMVIEVHGVPCIPPHDRMVDQLKIHFLKRRNSGGDVLTVIYPTSTPGQAYVVFESAKVPGVLECTHILDVDNRFYPIHVKKAHSSEVDMQCETTLDLSMFPKPESVLKLLNHYDFNVTEPIPGHLQLKGSFLKLKLIRNELVHLRGHEHQSHSRSPSALQNGSTCSDPRLVSKSTSRNMDKTDAVSRNQLLDSAPSLSSYRDSVSGGYPRHLQSSHSSYTERNASSPVGAVVQTYRGQDSDELLAHRRSPLADGASLLSANSPSSLTLLHHTSPLCRDSASGGSPRSLHSSYYSSIESCSNTVDTMQHHTSYRDSASGGSLRKRPSLNDDTWAGSSHSSPASSSGGMASFPVDRDTINFILTQRQDVVKVIEKDCGTEMGLKDNPGFTMVTFSGKNSEKAKACLLEFINEIRPSLRMQEIHLKKYDHAQQKRILERIQRNKDSGVTITHSDDVVKLVGSSGGSFEMMQKILGHSDDPHRGRAMERSSKSRRSHSVPRQYKLADNAHFTGHENLASAENKYSPSHYQEESDEGKALQFVRGPEQTPDKNSQRTRSNSASQDRNRAIREQAMHQDVELVSSTQEKKSPKKYAIGLLKRFDPNAKNIDFRKGLQKTSKSKPKNTG
ncbi:hypothetical protein PHYPO_G00170620 [Pangasianodon hypophthalmus]|uniref:RRM domain-containing protein n=1 Tax=Pangasianodon hypophthalmus TaxID=310915 RepID=A0A5N5JGN8_PANHP|nr:hypothetical protein PHYPO_G00170620 [Pangasianodon hypophthalmus]